MIYLQTASALALVIGLIGLFYYLARQVNNRVTGGASKRHVQVIERTPLGDKRSLLLVRVGQRHLLLGATSSTITMLSAASCPETEEKRSPKTEEREKIDSKISFHRILEGIR